MRIGTCIKITTTLNMTPDSIKITIRDQGGVVKVNDVNMTLDSNHVYSYIYQSQTTDAPGRYIITCKAAHGTYTAISQAIMPLDAHL